MSIMVAGLLLTMAYNDPSKACARQIVPDKLNNHITRNIFWSKTSSYHDVQLSHKTLQRITQLVVLLLEPVEHVNHHEQLGTRHDVVQHTLDHANVVHLFPGALGSDRGGRCGSFHSTHAREHPLCKQKKKPQGTNEIQTNKHTNHHSQADKTTKEKQNTFGRKENSEVVFEYILEVSLL